MQHQPHCPYDGYKMTEISGESHPSCEFMVYECPQCTHKAVMVVFESTGEFKMRSMIFCKCKGCRAERAKRNPELQKFFPDL